MKKGIFQLVVFFGLITTYAQREADETMSFPNKITDIMVVPFNGIVVISEGSNVHGYDPERSSILWTIENKKRGAIDLLSDIPIEDNLYALSRNVLNNGTPGTSTEFKAIEDTPFVQKFFDDKLFVFNSMDGKLLFEPGENEKYFETAYLFDENAILLRGLEDKQLILAKYSLSRKQFDWKTKVSETYGKLLQNFFKLSKEKQSWSADKMEYTSDKIFALIHSQMYVLNRTSGELLWSEEGEDIRDFRRTLDGAKMITIKQKGLLGNKSEIDLYDSESGGKIWDKSVNTKYFVLFEDWEDKMLLAHYKGFNFYDYDSGEKVWKKDPKGNGIKSVTPIGTDFLYVYDDEMMLLSKDGQKLWKKDVTISDDKEDPIFFLERTSNGRVLYITATYANMVDYKSGKKIWKKNLKLNEKRPTFAKYDEQSGNFVIYNDEKLYQFNENSSIRPEPFAKLKLKNEKGITSMDLFENNITISGENEVAGIDRSGNLVFHNKYVQPGELGRRLLKTGFILGRLGGAVAATQVVTKTTYRFKDGTTLTHTSDPEALFGKKTEALGKAGYVAGTALQSLVQKRFKAMKETNDFSLIFAKGESSEKLLVKVDKQTGKEIDKITLQNNKPIYDVDYVSENLYYGNESRMMIFKGN